MTYDCIRFFVTYRFLSMGLDELAENIDVDDVKIFRGEFLDKWQTLN